MHKRVDAQPYIIARTEIIPGLSLYPIISSSPWFPSSLHFLLQLDSSHRTHHQSDLILPIAVNDARMERLEGPSILGQIT